MVILKHNMHTIQHVKQFQILYGFAEIICIICGLFLGIWYQDRNHEKNIFLFNVLCMVSLHGTVTLTFVCDFKTQDSA